MSTLIDQNTLRALAPIDSLNPENLRELASKTCIETVAAGRYLFKKGDRDKSHVYILKGSVDLLDEKEVIKTVLAGSDDTKRPLAHSQPRHLSARVTKDCTVVRVDSNLLDIMMTWDQTGNYHVAELNDGSDGGHQGDNDDDWMTQLLQTKAFHKVPPANIQAIFMRMEPTQYKTGDVVIKQGSEGEYFYIIKSGRALVTRATSSNPKGIKLAELGPGDSFGEEALISENKRNATVTMLSKGTLVKLSKKDFISLLNEPILYWVDYEKAKEKALASDVIWLDVRLPSEFKLNRIKESVNLPLISMRLKLKSLDASKVYILYCDTGRRSSAAAYIVSKSGLNCYVLQDGMVHVPEADKVST